MGRADGRGGRGRLCPGAPRLARPPARGDGDSVARGLAGPRARAALRGPQRRSSRPCVLRAEGDYATSETEDLLKNTLPWGHTLPGQYLGSPSCSPCISIFFVLYSEVLTCLPVVREIVPVNGSRREHTSWHFVKILSFIT